MMRKGIFMMMLVAFMLVAAPVMAGRGEDSMGAVKTDLRMRIDTSDRYGSGDVAGWVIMNTDNEGILMVNVHLKEGASRTDYTVWVVVDGTWLEADLGTLETNKKGIGNAHLELTLSDYLEDDYGMSTVPVRVVVDNWYPGSTPLPYDGYATSEEDVPLKEDD